MGALAHVTDSKGEVVKWRSSEDDPKTSLNQHQSLSGEILTHFDINNLAVAQKLQDVQQERKETIFYKYSQHFTSII